MTQLIDDNLNGYPVLIACTHAVAIQLVYGLKIRAIETKKVNPELGERLWAIASQLDDDLPLGDFDGELRAILLTESPEPSNSHP